MEDVTEDLKKLESMEAEVKNLCKYVDEKESRIEKLQKILNSQTQSLTSDEIFELFFLKLAELQHIYISHKGGLDGFTDAINLIISAKMVFAKSN